MYTAPSFHSGFMGPVPSHDSFGMPNFTNPPPVLNSLRIPGPPSRKLSPEPLKPPNKPPRTVNPGPSTSSAMTVANQAGPSVPLSEIPLPPVPDQMLEVLLHDEVSENDENDERKGLTFIQEDQVGTSAQTPTQETGPKPIPRPSTPTAYQEYVAIMNETRRKKKKPKKR